MYAAVTTFTFFNTCFYLTFLGHAAVIILAATQRGKEDSGGCGSLFPLFLIENVSLLIKVALNRCTH